MRDAEGCQYMLDSPGEGMCGAQCEARSSYCPEHYAICHLPVGSAAERRKLREFKANGIFGELTKRMLRAPTDADIKNLERLLSR